MYSTSWRWPIFTKAHSTDIDYDNSMTGHSYGNRNFDQIFSANEAQDNENEKDLDICFVEHIDENFTEEISSTNNVHMAKQWLRLPYFGDQHNTLNGKFTDFDLSLKILLDATAGENMKFIPWGKKKMYFL